MSNIQIPNLPAVIALNGSEQLETVQAGVSSKVTVGQIGAFVQTQFPAPNANIVSVATLAALRALLTRPAVVITEGYAAPRDNGGGVWYWDDGDTTTVDNAGTVVQCSSANNGRYKRLYEGPLMIEWFGAVEGGVITQQLRNCLNYAATTGEAVTNFPGSTFDVDDSISVGGGAVQLLWDQQNALFRQTAKFKGLFLFPGNSSVSNFRWAYTTPRGFAITNIVLGNPTTIYTTANDFTTGDSIYLANIAGTTELNERSTTCTVLSATAFTVPIDSTLYTPYVSGGTAAQRPTTGGQGFSGWQAITGAWVTGDYVELHNGTAENFYSLACVRGPVVLNAAGPGGYDYRPQAVGFRVTDLRTISCDFVLTGGSLNGPYIRSLRMTSPTHYTVPPHMIYLQNPTVSPESISGAANNGAGGIRITTAGTNAFTTGLSVTIAGVGGTTEANGTWIVTRISTTQFDLQGSVFANAYTSGGSARVTMEGFTDGAQIYDVYLADYPYAEALKLSNFRFGTLEGVRLENCSGGNITLSYATNNKIVAPTILNVASGSYGIRQTDILGDDNQIIGGTITGAIDAHFYAVLAAGGDRLTVIGATSVSNFGVGLSSAIRTFANGSSGRMICRSCVDIQLQNNAQYSYGNTTNGGELLIDNPIQRGRQGLLRTGSGSTTRLMVTPSFVDSWDAGNTACINNAGTLTVTSVASLDGSSFTGLVALKSVAETYTSPVITAGALTINLAFGTVFNITNDADITTFTISNSPANKATAFTLVITANGTGYAQSWGAAVKWSFGAAPTLSTTNGAVDVLTFITNDGGVTWFGSISGQAY